MSPDAIESTRTMLRLLGVRSPTIVERTPQGYRLSGPDCLTLAQQLGRVVPDPCIVPPNQLSKLVKVMPPGLAIIEGT